MNYDDFIDGFLIRSIYMGAKWALRLWIPSNPMVVLGRFSKESEEIKEECKLPIKRRLGGGCSVTIYPGTIIVSLAINRSLRPEIFPRDWIAFINRSVISALEALGLDEIEEQGWGDITCKDKKIGGISLYSSKDVILYQLSLIYHLDIELIESSLKHPPREPNYRKGRNHRSFLSSIKEIAPRISQYSVMQKIEEKLREDLSKVV